MTRPFTSIDTREFRERLRDDALTAAARLLARRPPRV
jgi:hypothetical protein